MDDRVIGEGRRGERGDWERGRLGDWEKGRLGEGETGRQISFSYILNPTSDIRHLTSDI
jgi:hypothetical protein